MNAEALFAAGGFRVIAERQPIGYGWVEETSMGQLQRWVLSKLLGPMEGGVPSWSLEEWSEAGAPTSLDDWLEGVAKQWPQDGGYYVVAQSLAVLPMKTSSGFMISTPPPRYPRRAEVQAHAPAVAMARAPVKRVGRTAAQAALRLPGAPRGGAQGGGAGPVGPRDLMAPLRPVGQTTIPEFWLYQGIEPVGIGGGWIEGFEDGQSYFEGQELFLLQPGYRRAGTETLRTDWTAKSKHGLKSLAELQGHIETSWGEGCRYEVTGCNYYVGTELPPPWFL